MSRLTIDVTEQQHKNLKAMAASQGKTIRQYALEKLFPPPSADEELALEDLKALLDHRIGQAERGEIDARSISEIAADYLTRSQPHE